MSILNSIKNIFSNSDNELNDAIYMKEFSDNNLELQQLKSIVDKVSEQDKKEIENKIKTLSYGIYGERCVNYELKNSRLPIIILHNLYLEYRDYNSQIDFVVISKKFILCLECKNMIGNITVTDKGEFIRLYKNSAGSIYKKESMYSPIVQNEKHINIIKDIMANEKILDKNHLDVIKGLVVASNEKSFINTKYAPDSIKNNIVRCDNLINTMKNLFVNERSHCNLSNDKMKEIAYTLLKYNKDHVSTNINKYKVIHEDNISVNNNTNNSEFEKKIRENLIKYRTNKSREEGNKAYFVFTNEQLDNIIKVMPKNLNELLKIKGFGKVKCEKYGNDIINIVNAKV